MATVGVFARFEFKPGHDDDITRFFADAQTIVEGQPVTTGWYAFRLGATTFAAFAAFASDADRDALLATGGPSVWQTYGHLFATAPTFEKVDVVGARPPVAG